MDPHKSLAYLLLRRSYCAGGFRVVKYGYNGITEVGAFIDEGGNNFWGVEIYRDRGKTYVLASDRDFGLYIFRYTPAHAVDDHLAGTMTSTPAPTSPPAAKWPSNTGRPGANPWAHHLSIGVLASATLARRRADDPSREASHLGCDRRRHP